MRHDDSMKTAPQTQLRVPAQERFLPLVQGHVRDLSRTAGLPDKDVLALELATEEAFENICAHAYPDGTPGDVLVDGELLAGELRLAFHDEGLPFDPTLLDRPGAKPKGEGSGLGLKLIHSVVDEVRWVNQGRHGKALCLVKRLPLPEGAEPSAQERPGETGKCPRAPEQPYEVRPFKPDEALQVARLFWLAYGYSYKNEAFYRPEGLLDLVSRGVLSSYVVVTSEGEVVGHAGMLRPEPVPTAEMALLVISPAHRGRSLMERLSDCLSARALEMGLAGLSFNPVTSHPVSQRQSLAVNARPCGLDLAACPPRQFKAMRIKDGSPRRESYLHCFKYLIAPPPALAHVPERHRGMVGRIYAALGRELSLGQSAQDVSVGQPGAYSVSFDRGLAKGVVRVTLADARQWSEIRRAAMDLLDIAGAAVVHIELPLAQAVTPQLWEQAEAAGFFFTGVWPHSTGDGDLVRLTRLAAPLDLTLLRLYSKFAVELGAYVGAEMTRATGANEGVHPV
mgnify:CR=1 FL=1